MYWVCVNQWNSISNTHANVCIFSLCHIVTNTFGIWGYSCHVHHIKGIVPEPSGSKVSLFCPPCSWQISFIFAITTYFNLNSQSLSKLLEFIQNTKRLGIFFFFIKNDSLWILYFVAQNSLPSLKKPKKYLHSV